MRRTIPAMLTLGAVFALSAVAWAGLVDPDSEGVSAPYLITDSRVAPAYPPAAYAAKYEGTVTVRATVRKDGTVGDIEVLTSTRERMGFEAAVKDAVAQWRFEPARQEGEAVDSFTDVRLRFNPPSRGSRGSVSSGFGASPRVEAPIMVAKSGLDSSLMGGLDASLKPAFIPTDLPPVTEYGRPGCLGCLYDRRDLWPPGSTGAMFGPK